MTMTKTRIKHTLDNPYHQWAHQSYAQYGESDNHGHDAHGNRSFDGVKAKSYNATIAIIQTNKKGERLYLVSPRGWSVTTSRHQSEVRHAIPSGSTVVSVSDLSVRMGGSMWDTAHTANVNELWNRIAELRAKAERARKASIKEMLELDALRTMQQLRTYVSFFELKGKAFKVPTSNDLALADIRLKELQEAHEAELKAERKRASDAMAARKIEAQESVDAWIRGESVRVPYLDGLAYLRVNPASDTVETTQGASVPLSDVLPIIQPILRAIDAKIEYVPQTTVKLGHFTLSRVTPDGTVIVGCHRFAKSEVVRFAATLAVQA